jgi:translation initiation factor IF-2
MKQKLILVLCAVGLLAIGFAGGIYASSLVKTHSTNTAGVEASPVRQLAAAPDIMPETPATPQPRATAPGTQSPVKPPANESLSRATSPRAGTTPAPAANTGAANPPGGAPFAGGGRGQPRDPAAFEKLRGKMELGRLFRNVGQLEELKAPVTAKQAKAILDIMNPLRKQASLSPEEADKALAKLKAQLTKDQLDAIAQAASERMSRRGGEGGAPGPGGGARRGGWDGAPRPGGGAPGDGAPGGAPGDGAPGGAPGGRGMGGGGFGAQMETMNPFNPGENPMAQRMAERYNAVFEALEAKAGK